MISINYNREDMAIKIGGKDVSEIDRDFLLSYISRVLDSDYITHKDGAVSCMIRCLLHYVDDEKAKENYDGTKTIEV